jgi:hypothetical protein
VQPQAVNEQNRVGLVDRHLNLLTRERSTSLIVTHHQPPPLRSSDCVVDAVVTADELLQIDQSMHRSDIVYPRRTVRSNAVMDTTPAGISPAA